MTKRSAQEGAAVSPVMGVLLMAAITVAIAATALQITADLKEGLQAPAHVTLWTVPATPAAQVLQADLDLDWVTDVTVAGSCTPLLNGQPFPTTPGTMVHAGDVLTCGPGEDLVVGSSPDRGNTLLYQQSFP